MKPYVLIDFLNFGFRCQALKIADSNDYSAPGFNPFNLVLDYAKWRSQGTEDLDIYTEIYDSQIINCCIIAGSNISPRATVVLSGSNASGIGGFNTPLFQVGLTYSKGKWVYLNTGTALPACQYYRITISDPNPQTDYFEINKIFLGVAEQLPFEVIDGWTDSNESFQKRTITNGQWNKGTLNSILKTFSIPFRSGTTLVREEKEKIVRMTQIIQEVKTTRPFFFILNPNRPELY